MNYPFVIGQFFLYLLFSQAIELNSTDSWTKSRAPVTNWLQTSVDSTGQYLISVSSTVGPEDTGIYLSDDFGKTWTNIFINGCGLGPAWTAAAVDAQGCTYWAIQEDLGAYVSINCGKSWTRYQIDKTVYGYYNALAISGTSDAAYVSTSTGAIYVSRNFGYSFTKTSAPSEGWWSLATMSTGQIVVAVSKYLYVSTNYGSSWAKANAPAANWYQVHLSSNGQFMQAVAMGGRSDYPNGGVYTSSDYGKTFTVSSGTYGPLAWTTITSDASGQHVAAAVSSQGVYYSTDYGKTFQQSSTAPFGEAWRSFTCDANDGLYYTLTSTNGGHIYYSTTGI
jgi:photosystem II stability/assembly factor-like uncharacterized protein